MSPHFLSRYLNLIEQQQINVYNFVSDSLQTFNGLREIIIGF